MTPTGQAASCSGDRPSGKRAGPGKIPLAALSQQSAESSIWVKVGMAFSVILLIPWRFAKLHEKRRVFPVAICYEHIRLPVLVASRSAAGGGFLSYPFSDGINLYK